MRPLTAIVLAESAVIVALAMLWLGGSGGAAAPAPLPDRVAGAPGAAPTPLGSHAPTAPPPAAAAPRESAPPVRSAAAASLGPIGIVLSGTIRSSDGSLVDGATVYVWRGDTGRSGNSATPGCYAVAGLQPGEWRLTCRAEGFTQHEAKVVLDERPFQQVDVELRPNWIVRVKVLDGSGKSITRELRQQTMWGLPYVVATETPLAGDLPPTEQSRLIRFGIGEWHSYDGSGGSADPEAIEQGYCGELRMNRAPPAFASLLLRTTLLQGQRLEPGQQELVFTIAAADVLGKHGTVKLRLVDGTTGSPLAGAVVHVSTAQGGGTGGKTGEDGCVVIQHVVPGLGRLESHQPSADREQLFRYVMVPSAGTVDLGDVTLSAATKITGVVVDAAGKPANGVSLQWTELDGRTFPQPLVDYRSSTADAEGKFELWGCGRHRYVVFARTRGRAERQLGFATVDATAGTPSPVRITMASTTEVRLKTAFDMTVGRVVTALTGDRSPIAVATLGTEYRPESMRLPAGDYTIEVHDLTTHRLVRSQALHVGSEPLTLDVP